MTQSRTVSLVTLGCARNDVDSDELAARMEADGWELVDSGSADVVVVNTCGFVAAAKQESIDAILGEADLGVPVVAVGCLAERYGRELADSLPEAAAVIGFDGYTDLGDTLSRVVAGERPASHVPRDRRELLPITPVRRGGGPKPPGHAVLDLPGGSTSVLRSRRDSSPVAPLKIASGCDRRCSFCAIPRFRGAFVSRPPDDVVREALWLAQQGVREVVLVSENSTSYGKDLGDPRSLEHLLPRLGAVTGIERVRVSYLQPAEMRPTLIDVIAGTPGVAPYFDLSFQHASGPLLRRMRRFGDADSFLDLIDRIRATAPEAGIRSNVIVGFPGETDDDVQALQDFLGRAELDAVGVFGFSAEEGTEAADLAAQLDPDEIAARVAELTTFADHLATARAADRVDSGAVVIVEERTDVLVRGRTQFQGPEDGDTRVEADLPVGAVIGIVVTGSDGADLIGRPG